MVGCLLNKYSSTMSIEKFAVIGHPIAHSKSPSIHQAFAKQTGKAICYEAVLAPLDDFAGTVKRLQAEGYTGANVTVPFKFEAFALCQQLSARASAAGAVNTLSLQSSHIRGDNTDGEGLVNDILKHYAVIHQKNILLLGAGGAAQGVLLPIMAERPQRVVIANRHLDKAIAMRDKFAQAALSHGVQCEARALADCDTPFDLVINATAAGLEGTALALSPSVFGPHTLAYDMMYGRETAFMAQARAQGAQVADGLGMLVEQAAAAFYAWHGIRPETEAVIQSLRA